jgi:hypothetical protein
VTACGIQLAQPIGERRFVLRRQQQRGEHEIGHSSTERLERAFSRLGDDDLDLQLTAGERSQLRRLAAIRLNGKEDRHPRSGT